MVQVDEMGPVKPDPDTIIQLLSSYRQVHVKAATLGLTLFRREDKVCIALHRSIECLDKSSAAVRLKEAIDGLSQVKIVLFK